MLLLFLFACTLLTPITNSPAGASEVDTSQNESIETPVSDDASSSESDAEPEATEVPTEASLADDGTFSIVIDKWVCDDPATAPYGSTMYEDYTAACDTPMSATFTASDGSGYQESQTGSLVNFQAPANFLTITETVPAGYAQPTVFCGEVNNLQPAKTYMGGGAIIQVQGVAGGGIHCDWFNAPMPGEDNDPTDLIISTWECPAGYDETLPTADPILDCTTPQDGVTFTLDHPDPNETDYQSMTGDAIPGAVMFGGTAPGPYTIIETLPPGWDHGFLWECTDSQDNFLVSMASGESHMIDIPAGEEVHCRWFNVPMEPESIHYADLTIYKYTCPGGYDFDAPGADAATDCPMTTDGIEFTLTDNDPATADMTSITGDTSTGMAYFPDLAVGDYVVSETVPANTEATFMGHCIGLMDGVQRTYPMPLPGAFDFSVAGNDGHLTCHWYNVPMEEPQPTDITIYKYTCPAGYDVHAPGADPVSDCPDTTDGITFTLADEDPNTVDLVSMTGDSMVGAVSFGGLVAGSYTVTETVPADIDEVFILDCIGLMDGVQRPVPLSFGASFTFDVTGYEGHITCHWYNVPEDPHGSLTVIKYACWTEEFVAEVDCEIHEDGQTFDLLAWNGSGWTVVDTRTTNASGTIAWSNLPGGSYVIDEHDAEPCHITASYQDGSEHILVIEGEETVVKVYNCGFEYEWETPTTYPNTGVPPVSGETESASFALAMPMAALGLIGLVRSRLTRRPETTAMTQAWTRPELARPMTEHISRGL